MEWVGESAAKVQAVQVQVHVQVQNQQYDEGRDWDLHPTYTPWSGSAPDPSFSHLTPIRLPHPLGRFLLSWSAQTSASPKLLCCFSVVDDCLGPPFLLHLLCIRCWAAELQFHRRILALGLTERLIRHDNGNLQLFRHPLVF